MLRLVLLSLLLACAAAHPAGGRERLFVLGAGVIQQYSLLDGSYIGLFASKESTNGIIWGTDAIAQKDNLLYVGTYDSDPTKGVAGPGAIQVFTKSGRYLRRFDSGVVPLRPYGLKFARLPAAPTPSTPAGSSSGYYRPGGSKRGRDSLQLLVSGLGNEAVLTYAGGTGAFSGYLIRGDNTSSSAQGPNDLLVLGRRCFLTTEGSATLPSGEVTYPPHLKSALLSIDLDTRAVTLIATPDPAPNAGYVSLLGLDLIPDHSIFPGSGGAPVLVVSDFAGGLRFHSTASGALLKVVDTTFIDPTTGKRSSLNYGHVRVVRDHIFLAAFESSGGLAGCVLRFTLDGSPAGRADGKYAGTPMWIEPSDKIPRAIGLELVTL